MYIYYPVNIPFHGSLSHDSDDNDDCDDSAVAPRTAPCGRRSVYGAHGVSDESRYWAGPCRKATWGSIFEL